MPDGVSATNVIEQNRRFKYLQECIDQVESGLLPALQLAARNYRHCSHDAYIPLPLCVWLPFAFFLGSASASLPGQSNPKAALLSSPPI